MHGHIPGMGVAEVQPHLTINLGSFGAKVWEYRYCTEYQPERPGQEPVVLDEWARADHASL